jgi:hypothetical protein
VRRAHAATYIKPLRVFAKGSGLLLRVNAKQQPAGKVGEWGFYV